jgi:hypothetical protein
LLYLFQENLWIYKWGIAYPNNDNFIYNKIKNLISYKFNHYIFCHFFLRPTKLYFTQDYFGSTQKRLRVAPRYFYLASWRFIMDPIRCRFIRTINTSLIIIFKAKMIILCILNRNFFNKQLTKCIFFFYEHGKCWYSVAIIKSFNFSSP